MLKKNYGTDNRNKRLEMGFVLIQTFSGGHECNKKGMPHWISISTREGGTGNHDLETWRKIDKQKIPGDEVGNGPSDSELSLPPK